MEAGNLVLALKALEQAAKEVGGIWTNRRNNHLNETEDSGYKDLTADERRDMVTTSLQDAPDKLN